MRGALITIIWFPLLGAALSRLIGPGNWFLLGTGICGFVLFAGGLLGLSLAAMLMILAVGAITILMWRRLQPAKHRLQPAEHRLKPEPHRYPIIPTIATVIVLIVVLAYTLMTPVQDYDGRAFWMLKAKAIVHENGILGPFFRGQAAHSPRNSYPLLMPLNAAAVMAISGDMDDMNVRWLYALMLVALALQVRRELALLVSPPAGAWCAALLVWLPRMVNEEGGAASAYSDLALAAFATAALLELVRGESALRFGFWIAFACLTKNEGLPISLVLFAIGIVVFRKRIWPAAGAYAPALAVIYAWRQHVKLIDEADFVSLFSTLPETFARLPPAMVHAAKPLFSTGQWGLFWPVVILALFVIAWRRQWRPLGILLGFFTGYGATLVVLYMTALPNMIVPIDHAMPRLLLGFAGAGLIAIAFATVSGVSARSR